MIRATVPRTSLSCCVGWKWACKSCEDCSAWGLQARKKNPTILKKLQSSYSCGNAHDFFFFISNQSNIFYMGKRERTDWRLRTSSRGMAWCDMPIQWYNHLMRRRKDKKLFCFEDHEKGFPLQSLLCSGPLRKLYALSGRKRGSLLWWFISQLEAFCENLTAEFWLTVLKFRWRSKIYEVCCLLFLPPHKRSISFKAIYANLFLFSAKKHRWNKFYSLYQVSILLCSQLQPYISFSPL